MLEVHSPVPLTEGESLIWGISTKHVMHFFVGIAASSPLSGLVAVVLPLFHGPRFASIFLSIGIGLLFAAVPYGGRPIAAAIWLGMRFSRRPKVVLYDRQYRIRTHRSLSTKDGTKI